MQVCNKRRLVHIRGSLVMTLMTSAMININELLRLVEERASLPQEMDRSEIVPLTSRGR